MTRIRTPAETAMERCELLGTISEEAGTLTRQFAGEAMRRAHERVGTWMRDAGMTVRRDNIGNLRARYEGVGPGVPTILLGSHLDTVRDAGKYDGPLGVVVAIGAVQALHDIGRRQPYAIEVLAFADEEGLRFSSTYLGSRVVAGTFDPTALAQVDDGGTTMADAIRTFGGDPDRLADDRWREGELLGYCEVHIEQGPVLEAREIPVGVVSAIAGQGRYRVTFTGQAGHAGTVPMGARRDALAAAAEFVLAVEADASSHAGAVATVGQLTVHPGAANVVPGEASLSLDVRHSDDKVRSELARHILERAREIATRRNVDVGHQLIGESPSVRCAPRLVSLLTGAVEAAGLPVIQLVSGAGHDAVPMASLTDVGMLFVRCKGGISHNPAEAVTTEDVAVSIEVLGRFLDLLAKE